MNCPKLANGTMMGLLRHWVHLFTIPQPIVCGNLYLTIVSANQQTIGIIQYPTLRLLKLLSKIIVNTKKQLKPKFSLVPINHPMVNQIWKTLHHGMIATPFHKYLIRLLHLQCLFGTSRSGSIDRWHWRLGAWEISRGIERDLSITSRKTGLGSSGFHRQWSKFQDNKYNNGWNLNFLYSWSIRWFRKSEHVL